MQLLPEVLLYELGRRCHAVKVSIQVLLRHRARHLLFAHLRVKLVLVHVLTLLVVLLIDDHLLDDASVREFVVSLVLLRRDLLGQLVG